VKLGVNSGSGDDGYFGMEVWIDIVKLVNMIIAGFGDM